MLKLSALFGWMLLFCRLWSMYKLIVLIVSLVLSVSWSVRPSAKHGTWRMSPMQAWLCYRRATQLFFNEGRIVKPCPSSKVCSVDGTQKEKRARRHVWQPVRLLRQHVRQQPTLFSSFPARARFETFTRNLEPFGAAWKKPVENLMSPSRESFYSKPEACLRINW